MVVIGIRNTRAALRYKWLYSVMVEQWTLTHGNRAQDPARASFLYKFIFTGPLKKNIGSTPPIYCIVTDKAVWLNNFTGPGTLKLKVTFPCINSA